MQGGTTVPKCFYRHASRIFFVVRAKPGSKKQGIQSINDDHICVCIKSPPVDGKANAGLVEYFSDIFDVSKSDVALEKGGTSKNKLISIIDGFSDEYVINILNENLI